MEKYSRGEWSAMKSGVKRRFAALAAMALVVLMVSASAFA